MSDDLATSGLLARQITAMILTFNEAANIERCLSHLNWAETILIVDSGSTDATLEIVRAYPQVKIASRDFDDFASQCNFGLSLVKSTWVLSLDADYELCSALEAEIQTLELGRYDAYEAAFTYCINGRPLRGTLYPPRKVLYRKEKALYRNEGHGHRVEISGPVGRLKEKIRHDDRKPLSRWLATQQKYAEREANFLLSRDQSSLRCVDRIRRMGWLAPIAVFLYSLIWKGCLLDGWPGWFYVLQRTLSEIMIALEIVDRRVAIAESSDSADDNSWRSS